MNIILLFGFFYILSPIQSKPLDEKNTLKYTSLQVLPLKTCADLMAAGHDVKINTPDEGEFNYAMCVIKVPTKSNTVVPESRRSYERPNVEVGPGEFKSEIINYGPEYLANKLKFLMEQKQKIENEQKKKQEILKQLDHA